MSRPRSLRLLAIFAAAAVAVATSYSPLHYEPRDGRGLWETEGILVRLDEAHPMGEVGGNVVEHVDAHFVLKNGRAEAVAFSTERASLDRLSNVIPVSVQLAPGQAKEFCVRFRLAAIVVDQLPRRWPITLGHVTLRDGRTLAIESELER